MVLQHYRCYRVLSIATISLFLSFQFMNDVQNVNNISNNKHDFPPSAASDAYSDHIKVFYNVYAKPGDNSSLLRAMDYAKEQMSLLLPDHHVFVRSIGTQFYIQTATRLQHDEEGNEVGTLKLLWDHCQNSDTTNQTVVYLHNKGSLHPTKANDLLRKWLTRAALSKECSNMPLSCNVCSWRFSPLPHPHTGGNMWAARCSYIQKLIEPTQFQKKMAQLYRGGNNPFIGTGRFAAEHWVHSHPTIQACDLSTSAFTWAYRRIPSDGDDFKLEAGPRYDYKTFDIKNWQNKADFVNFEHRWAEYKFLYNETPPSSWFGWKFYSDSIPANFTLPDPILRKIRQ